MESFKTKQWVKGRDNFLAAYLDNESSSWQLADAALLAIPMTRKRTGKNPKTYYERMKSGEGSLYYGTRDLEDRFVNELYAQGCDVSQKTIQMYRVVASTFPLRARKRASFNAHRLAAARGIPEMLTDGMTENDVLVACGKEKRTRVESLHDLLGRSLELLQGRLMAPGAGFSSEGAECEAKEILELYEEGVKGATKYLAKVRAKRPSRVA